MPHHRLGSSRHRDARGRHRTVARAGRGGMLLAAMLTTGAIGVAAFDRYEEASSAPAGSDDGTSTRWLFDDLAALEAKVRAAQSSTDTRKVTTTAELPAQSGQGRRVVFDISGQRVWIVGAEDKVRSTYLVSGSRSDNLKPGRYRVYSRSRWAVGFDRHSTMQFFVRFARGETSNIGFHDIPVDHDGKRLQSSDALGTPQSAGCIRQKRPDAKRMWRFASVGTRVVVVQ